MPNEKIKSTYLERIPKIASVWQAGCRKTTFFGTAALDERTAPVLWINYAGNPQSILNLNTSQSNITILDMEKPEDLNLVYDYLVTGQKETHKFAQAIGLHMRYKSVVIDGITEVQRLVFDSAMLLDNNIGNAVPTTEWTHYRQVLAQMLRMSGAIYSLTMNVMFTALEADARVDKPIMPALQGQSRTLVPSYALGVYHIAHKSEMPAVLAKQLGINYSVLQIVPTREIYCKNQHRLKKQIEYIPNPTIPTLLDMLDTGKDMSIEN